MKAKRFFKALLRSGNYRFAREIGGGAPATGVQSLNYAGVPYYYRPGTSDAFVAYECFLHGEKNAYFSRHLPPADTVRTIVDVGANVGASVRFWKHAYPAARIHCFEPIPSNFDVLKKNCERLPDVTPHNEALGEETGELTFIHSPGTGNEGGWSIFQRGNKGDEQKLSIPIYNSGSRLAEFGVTEIDILKVDTEGAEKMIIKGLGTALLSKTKYICGELHGERDFELLDYLEMNGFRIGARKSPKSTLFNFEAIRQTG